MAVHSLSKVSRRDMYVHGYVYYICLDKNNQFRDNSHTYFFVVLHPNTESLQN